MLEAWLIVFAAGVLIWTAGRVRRRSAKFNPIDGLGFFCLNMVVFLTTAPYIQSQFGLWGLLGTELFILIPSLLVPLAVRQRPRVFFRLYPPRKRHLLGGLLLWLGAVSGAYIATNLVTALWPQAAVQIESVGQAVTDGSLPLILLAVVIAPAVCEELLHRGVILASLRGQASDTVIVLAGGLLFGLFHMDGPRFPAAAILGMALTYAALRSESIVLPMLLHGINNLLSAAVTLLSGSLTGNTAEAAGELPQELQTAAAIGSAVIMASLSLGLLSAGYLLLRDPTHKRPAAIPILALCLTLAVVLLGLALL